MKHDGRDAQGFIARILSETSGREPIASIKQTVITMKETGFSVAEIYEALENVRAACDTEEKEDIVLDVMDLVWGFCHPGNRIW